MAVPVINDNQSVLAYGIGQDFTFQMSATEAPTSWRIGTSDILPPGVFFDVLNGTISGSGTTAGIWSLNVFACNSDGCSIPVLLTIGVFEVGGREVYRDVKVDLDNFSVLPNPFDAAPKVVEGSSQVVLDEADMTARLNDDLIFRIGFVKLASTKKTTVTPPTGPTTSSESSTSETKITSSNNLVTVTVGGKEVVYEMVNAPLIMARFSVRGNVSDPPFIKTDALAFKRTTELVGADFVAFNYVYASVSGLALESWLSEMEKDLSMDNNVYCEFELEFESPARAPGPKTQIITTKPFVMRVMKDITV